MNEITVIILTKNEEKNIEKCILSAKQIAQRIIVVDSGSIDKTIELAKRMEQRQHTMNGLDMLHNLIGL